MGKAGRTVRNYQTRFGVGWHETGNTLRITIPDTMHFPAERAWVWLNDNRNVVLSPNKPTASVGAIDVSLRREGFTPGCRHVLMGGARLDGAYFGMADTTHEVRGEDFVVHIPDQESRRSPRRRWSRKRRLEAVAAMRNTAARAEQQSLRNKPVVNGEVGVKTLVCWTDFGLPADAILEIPLSEAKALCSKFGRRA